MFIHKHLEFFDVRDQDGWFKKVYSEYRRSRLAARAAQRGTYIDIPHVLDSISELLQEVGESFPNNTSLNSQSYASKMLDQEEVDKYNRLYAIPLLLS